MKRLFLILSIIGVGSIHSFGQQEKTQVLMVLSSHKKLGNTGKETGYYLSEVTHAYEVFEAANFEITFVSPQGGTPPVDGFDLTDPINKKYWENEAFQSKLQATKKPDDIQPLDYHIIYYAGGHGTMWDFPKNKKLSKIATKIYENNGVIAAVCHGPSALVNIKLSDGSYLVDGKNVSAFTNEEEEAVELTKVVPFLLETTLKERGAIIVKTDQWKEQVSVDERLVTGQNPASAKLTAQEAVKLIINN